MNRNTALRYIRVAGYHNDTGTYTKILVGNRLSKAAADEAWRAGVEARDNNVPCRCGECLTEKQGI